MKIIYTSKFLREYKRLPNKVKEIAEQEESIFRKSLWNQSLKTHKLAGKFKEFHAFSINQKYRVIFEFGNNDEVYFHSIGDREIYKSK